MKGYDYEIKFSGSEAQKQRRRRIVDVTLDLASEGGYEAVQMREVATRAGVALGTLYRYFPSKVHLLIGALPEELGRAQERRELFELPGDTAYERMLFLFEALAESLQRDPNLTEALTRAVIMADASAREEIDAVADVVYRLFASALTTGPPTEEHLALARVVGDVWLANMSAWLAYRASPAEIISRLELTLGLLLSEDDRRSSAVV